MFQTFQCFSVKKHVLSFLLVFKVLCEYEAIDLSGFCIIYFSIPNV